jgi:HAMP domain-containing protein
VDALHINFGDIVTLGSIIAIAILIIGGAYIRQVLNNRQIRKALEHARDQLEQANKEIKEEKRRREQAQLAGEVQSLRQRNPDLGVVIDVVKAQQVDLDGQEAVLVTSQKTDWRSFLFGTGQNIFFFVLGVITPIMLNHFHVS